MSKRTVVDAESAKRDISAIFERFGQTRILAEANEATTRSELIDEIVRALGWTPGTYDREVPGASDEFLDYLFSIQDVPWLVVEAKKAGKTFSLDLTGRRQAGAQTVALSTLFNRAGATFRSCTEQAARYCQSRGVPFACVTNGYQWVFFRGLSRAARPWTTGKGLIFPSAQVILDSFSEFFSCLGRTPHAGHYLSQYIDRSAVGEVPDPIRPADLIDCPRARDTDADRIAALRMVEDYFLTEIFGDQRPMMLEHCYVSPEVEAQFDSTIRRLLRDAAQPREDCSELVEGGQREFLREISTRDTNEGFKDPVVVVGHLGSGKSTFLRRVIRELNADGISHGGFTALANLEGRGRGGQVDSGREDAYVAARILESLGNSTAQVLTNRADLSDRETVQGDPNSRETLASLCHKELERDRRVGEALWAADPVAWSRRQFEILTSLRDDPVVHLTRFIRHLRARFSRTDGSKYPVVIVLDNLDQATDEYQRCVYGLAQRLAVETQAIVVVSIRDDTYAEGRSPHGFLSSSPLQFVFHVKAPPFDHVLRKRVQYMKWGLETSSIPRNVRNQSNECEWLRKVVEDGMLEGRAQGAEILSDLSAQDTRGALGLTRGVVTGASLVETRVDGSPEFVFESLLALGRWDDAERAKLVNLFDVPPVAPVMHALRSRLLGYFDYALTARRTLPMREVTEHAVALFAGWGYPVRLVEDRLRDLIDAGLLAARDPKPSEPKAEHRLPVRLRITASGHVHLRRLLELPVYRTVMGCLTRWYQNDLAREYVARVTKIGGDLGVTIGDIAVSTAPELFDAYLRKAVCDEDRYLSNEISGEEWAREVLARSAGLTANRRQASDEAGTSTMVPPTQSVSRPQGRARSAHVDDPELFAPEEFARQEVLRRLPGTVVIEGTLWIPRILWALEWAKRHGQGPRSASDLARILHEEGEIGVPATNVARALRDTGIRTFLLPLMNSVGKRYSITEAGTALLLPLLKEEFE